MITKKKTFFENIFYLEETTIFNIQYKKNNKIDSELIIFITSFGISTISTAAITALYANAVIIADVAAYILPATFIITTICAVVLMATHQTIYTKQNVKQDVAIAIEEGNDIKLTLNSVYYAGSILFSTSLGYILIHHCFIVNSSTFGSISLLGQASIAAAFALIIPLIGSGLLLINNEIQEKKEVFAVSEVLPILIGTALGTFTAVAMNIETGSMAINMTTELLAGCAIAISSTVILSWLFHSIYKTKNQDQNTSSETKKLTTENLKQIVIEKAKASTNFSISSGKSINEQFEQIIFDKMVEQL